MCEPSDLAARKRQSADVVPVLLVDGLVAMWAVNFQSPILTGANISDSGNLCLSKISVLLQMDSLIMASGWMLVSFQLSLFCV